MSDGATTVNSKGLTWTEPLGCEWLLGLLPRFNLIPRVIAWSDSPV